MRFRRRKSELRLALFDPSRIVCFNSGWYNKNMKTVIFTVISVIVSGLIVFMITSVSASKKNGDLLSTKWYVLYALLHFAFAVLSLRWYDFGDGDLFFQFVQVLEFVLGNGVIAIVTSTFILPSGSLSFFSNSKEDVLLDTSLKETTRNLSITTSQAKQHGMQVGYIGCGKPTIYDPPQWTSPYQNSKKTVVSGNRVKYVEWGDTEDLSGGTRQTPNLGSVWRWEDKTIEITGYYDLISNVQHYSGYHYIDIETGYMNHFSELPESAIWLPNESLSPQKTIDKIRGGQVNQHHFDLLVNDDRPYMQYLLADWIGEVFDSLDTDMVRESKMFGDKTVVDIVRPHIDRMLNSSDKITQQLWMKVASRMDYPA